MERVVEREKAYMSVSLGGDVDTSVGTSHTPQDVRVSFLDRISIQTRDSGHVGTRANGD